MSQIPNTAGGSTESAAIAAALAASESTIVTTTGTQTLTNKTLTSPVLTTPTLGVASATTVNKVTITAPATGSTLTIPDGVTLTGPAASGTAATLAGTETLTNKTFTGPIYTDKKVCTTQLDATSNTTLANIVGLTGFSVVAAGVYIFRIHLAGTSTANGGVKVALKFTTATLTAMEATGYGYVAAGVAVQHTTTATDQASLFALTAAATIATIIEGRITVNAAGTIAVQFAQNASHSDTSSVYIGSFAEFTRVA